MTTFLLIHGSYQGGWIWKPVATRLRAAGHLVFAPSLDGCGERAAQVRPGITTETQAAELAGFLEFEDLRDVVLVGASSGGMVMAKTAELARERVDRLFFIDALALRHGEKIRDIVSSRNSMETPFAAGPTHADRLKRFLLDMDEKLATWAADRSTLHPVGVANQPVVLEKFWTQTWNATVVFCPQAGKPGEAHQRRTSEALGAKWIVLDTGHYPMLSMPDAVTQILLGSQT
jgi:pimeloyl-ACP methyl ester carboxylesterase